MRRKQRKRGGTKHGSASATPEGSEAGGSSSPAGGGAGSGTSGIHLGNGNPRVLAVWRALTRDEQVEVLNVEPEEVLQALKRMRISVETEAGQGAASSIEERLSDHEQMGALRLVFMKIVNQRRDMMEEAEAEKFAEIPEGLDILQICMLLVMDAHLRRFYADRLMHFRGMMYSVWLCYWFPWRIGLLGRLSCLGLAGAFWNFRYPWLLSIRSFLFDSLEDPHGDPSMTEAATAEIPQGLAMLLLGQRTGVSWHPGLTAILAVLPPVVRVGCAVTPVVRAWVLGEGEAGQVGASSDDAVSIGKIRWVIVVLGRLCLFVTAFRDSWISLFLLLGTFHRDFAIHLGGLTILLAVQGAHWVTVGVLFARELENGQKGAMILHGVHNFLRLVWWGFRFSWWWLLFDILYVVVWLPSDIANVVFRLCTVVLGLSLDLSLPLLVGFLDWGIRVWRLASVNPWLAVLMVKDSAMFLAVAAFKGTLWVGKWLYEKKGELVQSCKKRAEESAEQGNGKQNFKPR
uniref:Uncharacterized protein n=1 Tax=Chromera velia CCMP2878 TaxID=1169474 RepID=A0A0G4FYY2_9ALVE|eukprot:Cvel_3948.t1-p1 / transcript=Cvel_3948.t1 / gene=Cvel_3948 / organism=Chromera_velia_CCMP2878 / gene_product=hypothetical protein / transcript_product=hypothetical protein / location=Cvel_scaffold167:104434-108489(+) / protein_length=514 / sequence_SO=supercontig / SO=protein_coding / is_pseudo=false